MTCSGCGSPHEHDCPYCGRDEVEPEQPEVKVVSVCVHRWIYSPVFTERRCAECGLVMSDRAFYALDVMLDSIQANYRAHTHVPVYELGGSTVEYLPGR